MSWILIVVVVAILVGLACVVLWAALAVGARADAGEWTTDLLELDQGKERAPQPVAAVDPEAEQRRRERLDAAAALLLAARGLLSAEHERPGRQLPADALSRLTGAAAMLETLLAEEEARRRPAGRFRRRASRPTRSEGR